MKVYIIRYYNEISGSWEIYGVFSNEEKAKSFCEEANKNFPQSETYWTEYEVK